MYEVLAEPTFRTRVEWPKLDVFWGDERTVPPEHEDSNFGMADQALLSKVTVDRQRVHRLQGEAVDLEQAAAAYQREIAERFDIRDDGVAPVLDLVLLGIGTDGHTASLFPHTAALNEQHRWVVVNRIAQTAADRLTLTTAILNRAATIHFLVTGSGKARTLEEVLKGPSDPHRLPAQLIRPISGQVVWFVDRDAAAQL